MTPLQRRTLEYLATVDSATPAEVAQARFGDQPWLAIRPAREVMARLITAGHARNISTSRRCVYRITLQGRQAIAPPLVCVAWKDGQSASLKPATAEALRVALDERMGPGTHWVVPT
jgi:hypothetical protein